MRVHCSFVRSNANNSHRLRAKECTYKPLVLLLDHITDRRVFATLRNSRTRRTIHVPPYDSGAT